MNTSGQKVFIFADDCAVIEWYGSKGNIVHITVSDLRHTRAEAEGRSIPRGHQPKHKTFLPLLEKDVDDEAPG